jgi:hypothetical protein
MSEATKTQTATRSKAWMFLVAAFAVLVIVGVLTT